MNDLAPLVHTAVTIHDNPSDDDLVHQGQHARVHPEGGFLSFLARLRFREGYNGHFDAPRLRFR